MVSTLDFNVFCGLDLEGALDSNQSVINDESDCAYRALDLAATDEPSA